MYRCPFRSKDENKGGESCSLALTPAPILSRGVKVWLPLMGPVISPPHLDSDSPPASEVCGPGTRHQAPDTWYHHG
ncbi:hypothetical protein RRG08_008553 [Elysia crispata]|uniref:Uncharacterized protein n=1 Tax=Elysia crispata TaxID=231223 RepID=A0AAE0YNE2_9GAST|nr:hypothetical protein RRG08_008553 [Elysia crispata]